MRRPLISFVALALAGAAFAPAASAATITGVFDPPDFNQYTLGSLALPGPGHYRLSFDLSRPGFGAFVVNWTKSYDVYDRPSGDLAYGDDIPFEDEFDFAPPLTHFTELFFLPPPYKIVKPDTIEIGRYHDGMVTLRGAFEGSDPVTFTVRADAVPEPAAWALLIAGFGAMGSVLRRRRAMAPV